MSSKGACLKSMLFTTSRCWGNIQTKASTSSLRFYSCQAHGRWTTSPTVLLRHRSLTTANSLLTKRRKGFFSSNSSPKGPQRENDGAEQQQLQQLQESVKERKAKQSPAGKTSLRRVAIEAQRSKDGHDLKRLASSGSQTNTKVEHDTKMFVSG